ncbi:hypothetical protein HDK64DRAFT_210516 [Phyllosticta capitalensis]
MRLKPSWVKRLSLVSLAPSSTRTDSPTPSQSNGSVTFSHDGSTAPIIGSTSPAPLPPNKLVKRSTSVRQPGGLERSTTTSSKTTLRRPATSHQRSQTWGQQRLRTDVYADQQPERWKQYFSGRATTVGKKQARVITRIVAPSDKYNALQAPTLVLANAVAAPSLEMDDATSQAGDSDDARSAGQSPAAGEGAPLSIPTATAAAETPAEALAGSETGQGADRPSRFFSKSVPQQQQQQEHSVQTPRRRVVRAVGRLHATVARANHHAPSSATPTPSESPETDLTLNTHPTFTAQPRPNASFDSTRPHSLRRDSRSVSNASNSIPSTRIPPQTPTSPLIPGRPSRYSIAASEHASTLVGSDDRLAFSDDSDFDFQSDTVFDSMRTRGTRASSGAPAPGIETIFDESPRSIKSKVSPLRDLLPKGVFPQLINPDISEEEESQSTPVRSRTSDKGLRESVTPVPRTNSISGLASTPSPPKGLRLPSFSWDDGDADEDSLWSIDDNDSSMWDDPDDSIPQMGLATPLSLKRSNPILIAAGPSPAPRASTDTHDRDTKSSIFDWSEPGPERGQGNRTPPRPSTVHGKKDAQNRGGRPVGRRAPSGLHARSQSVPVVPDLAGKRDTMTNNKFGTWATSKGATEDWNDDFDFSVPEEESNGIGGGVLEVPKTIVVPPSIRAQQPTMRANIGLLREWFTLIGELKELRVRATTLNILEGPFTDLWQEVDAMIDLADQEVDDPLIPSLSPPSSPGFDADAFEEASTPASNRARGRSNLHRRDSIGSGASSSAAISVGAHRRKSILPTNASEDVFSSPSPTRRPPQETPHATPSGRPRKNSEAVARSVIEALQQRRNTATSAPAQSTPPGKKVPFDTATLKHIVPYVNGLMRKVKEALRETERLYSSPVQTPRGDEGEASFSSFFCTEVPEESPSSRCTQPRSRINLAAEAFQAPKDTDVVAQQLRSLTVV